MWLYGEQMEIQESPASSIFLFSEEYIYFLDIQRK